MKVRAIAPERDAYQYTGALIGAPAWVQACCEYRGGNMVLMRQSGDQVVNRTEWLVRDLAGDPEWYTDADFTAEFERVP